MKNFLPIWIGAVCWIFAPMNAPTFAADNQWQGAGRVALKNFVARKKGMLDLPHPIAFYGDFNGDGQEDAIVFVYTDIEGAAGNSDLQVALFKGDGSKFRFLRNAPNVFGSEPRQPRFSDGLVEITMTTLRPSDPRCCPSGSKRYRISTK